MKEDLPTILAIETSCDDTCAAVVRGREMLSNVIHTQVEHEQYGGVVPEVASRAHLERLDGVIESAFTEAGMVPGDIEGIAVTVQPGLIGALLVGVAAAKGLAYAWGLPLTPVNHLEGHVSAAYLVDPTLEPPFIALIASGGHTALYYVDRDRGMRLLGQTLDDAAGEALDKGARMLGLGFPGGPALQRAAVTGDAKRFEFPIAMMSRDNLDFSFSGLKTSLLYKLKEMGETGIKNNLHNLSASYQAAVVEALARKLLRAAEMYQVSALVVAGGVAANTSLRHRLGQESKRLGLKLVIPPPELCTDNAAMIGAAALHIRPIPYPEYLSLNARSI